MFWLGKQQPATPFGQQASDKLANGGRIPQQDMKQIYFLSFPV